MSRERNPDAAVSLGRHKGMCSVCRHPQREEIEAAFIGWRSPAAIAEDYGLADRASVYRHSHALGLLEKRRRNVRAALERIIEKAGEVDVTASAVVGAVQAYSKINAAGEWIDRTETVSLNDLFDRMSTQELEAYAQSGVLPEWFRATTAVQSPSQSNCRAKRVLWRAIENPRLESRVIGSASHSDHAMRCVLNAIRRLEFQGFLCCGNESCKPKAVANAVYWSIVATSRSRAANSCECVRC
jgi:hypothetical protein